MSTQPSIPGGMVKGNQLSGWVVINGDGKCGHYSCLFKRIARVQEKGRQPPGNILHSSNERGELLQALCYNDSTIRHCRVYYHYYIIIMFLHRSDDLGGAAGVASSLNAQYNNS